MDVVLRPWSTADVGFCLKVRNHPDLMKYFRQNKELTQIDQEIFIALDRGTYNGCIIGLKNGTPVGLCGVKNTKEFTLGLLPEYQHLGIATAVMQKLIAAHAPIWSEVFVGNPALEWFIGRLGFKVVGVKERAYYKVDQGLVDVVRIRHE